MRNDMHKVVTERPRRKTGATYRHVGRVNRQDCMRLAYCEEHDGVSFHNSRKFSTYCSMRRPYRFGYENSKQFSDLIGPLVRYLHGRVGDLWNDVYSEICQTLPRDGMNADHIRSHVTSEVTVDYLIVDGQLCNHRGWPLWYGLYVDQDGILQKVATRPKYKDRCKEDWLKRHVKCQGMEFLREPQSGIWYQIQSRIFQPDLSVLWPRAEQRCYLLEQREQHSKMWAKARGYKYYPAGAYVRTGQTYYVKIKQASKKDKQKYGLI